MDEANERDLEAVRAALAELAGGDLTGDALLNAAIERAGYDVGESRIEQCANCGVLFNTDYGGEYASPWDYRDLQRELRIRGMRKLFFSHFCDFDCLRQKAYMFYQPY